MDITAEIRKMIRVLRVATRPRQKEFEHMAKVTAIGVIVMGAFGLIVAAIFSTFDMI